MSVKNEERIIINKNINNNSFKRKRKKGENKRKRFYRYIKTLIIKQ